MGKIEFNKHDYFSILPNEINTNLIIIGPCISSKKLYEEIKRSFLMLCFYETD